MIRVRKSALDELPFRNDFERWCKLSEHEHKIRDRLLSVYIALFNKLVLVNLAYLGGVLGVSNIFEKSSTELSIVFGMFCACLSIVLALSACVPGILCYKYQREYLWEQERMDDEKALVELQTVWNKVNISELYASALLLAALALVILSFIALLVWF